MEQKRNRTNERIALRISVTTILANAFLAAMKLLAGILAQSAALLSDAVHSLVDVLVTFIVIIGIKIGSKASDDGHLYRYERMESAVAILISGVLFITGAGIGYSGMQRIFSGEYNTAAVPGAFALVAVLLSIVVKEVLFLHIQRAAKRIDSNVLMADAWHQRVDSFSSIGSLFGIAGLWMGFPILDPVAGVLICLFIVKAAVRIFKDAIHKITGYVDPVFLEKEPRPSCIKQDGLG